MCLAVLSVISTTKPSFHPHVGVGMSSLSFKQKIAVLYINVLKKFEIYKKTISLMSMSDRYEVLLCVMTLFHLNNVHINMDYV